MKHSYVIPSRFSLYLMAVSQLGLMTSPYKNYGKTKGLRVTAWLMLTTSNSIRGKSSSSPQLFSGSSVGRAAGC